MSVSSAWQAGAAAGASNTPVSMPGRLEQLQEPAIPTSACLTVPEQLQELSTHQ